MYCFRLATFPRTTFFSPFLFLLSRCTFLAHFLFLVLSRFIVPNSSVPFFSLALSVLIVRSDSLSRFFPVLLFVLLFPSSIFPFIFLHLSRFQVLFLLTMLHLPSVCCRLLRQCERAVPGAVGYSLRLVCAR